MCSIICSISVVELVFVFLDFGCWTCYDQCKFSSWNSNKEIYTNLILNNVYSTFSNKIRHKTEKYLKKLNYNITKYLLYNLGREVIFKIHLKIIASKIKHFI